jgi:hypothetical protein
MKMKYVLYLIACFSISYNCFSQNVSTEIQKKNVLMEEFTGIHCGTCPEGQTIINNMLTARPAKDVYAISIHANYYAVPNNAGQPDFRTPEGTAIDAYFVPDGYPMGMLNRKAYPFADVVISRSLWISTAKKVHSENAPVNLWVSSVFDGANRQLTINVEGYYTAQVAEDTNFLNVAIVQNDITGYQNGIGGGANYVHKHVLRGFATGTWGDTLNNPTANKFFAKQYIYTLPQMVGNVELKAEDIEVAAFVSASRQGEVYNVVGKQPEYQNYNKPIGAKISSAKFEITSTTYGFNYFEAKIKNLSDVPVTSAQFNVLINNDLQNVSWEGEVPPYAEKEIRIDVAQYTFLNSNTFSIQLTGINGENYNGNSISGDFIAPVKATKTLTFVIKTDNFAAENLFVVKDKNGVIVHTFEFDNGVTAEYTENLTLDTNEVYCFEIQDFWGDGIVQGTYKIRNADGNLAMQNYNIPMLGTRFFFQTSKPLPSGLETINIETLKYFVDGENNLNISFEPTVTGKTLISIISLEGKILISKELNTESGISVNEKISLNNIPKSVYVMNISNLQNGILIITK